MSYRRQGREERSDLLAEHPWGDAGQIVLAGLFLAVWVTDTFFLRYTTFINSQVPSNLRIAIGIVNVLVALYLASASHRILLGQSHDEPKLIRAGVFGIVRHPMYLGEILLYLGVLLFSLSLAAAGVWILVIAFLHVIARYEERQLLAHFGNEYRDYMSEVRMWWPSVSGGMSNR
jgi:protein-S-isoprenylcysteine O-methyltransferase Ste14